MHSTAGQRLSLLFLLLLPALLFGSVADVRALGFNAFWEYREAGGDNVDTLSEFQQRYNLGVGPGVELRPTHAISLAANLAYNRTQADVGQGMETFDEVIPSAILSVTNDIFMASLSGLAVERSGSAGFDTSERSWDATLGSNWQRDFWPNLRLNYGENTETTEDGTGATVFDTEDRRYSASLDWDLKQAKLFYDYSTSEQDDLFFGSRTDTESHFVRAETSQTFWQKRIGLNLAQQYQQSTSDVSVQVATGETFALRLEGGQTLSAVTDPLTGPDPADVLLEGNPLLGDLDRLLPALTVDPDQRMHLGIRFALDQQIDELHLYLDPLSVAGEQAAALRWDLYIRNLLDTEWELAAVGIPSLFDATENRIVLSTALRQRQVMVVATNTTGVSLVFTELEAISLLSGDTGTRQRSYLTNASLRVQLTPTLTASSSLIYERTDSEFSSEGAETDSETTRRSLTGNLRWSPTPYVIPSLGYSETLQTATDTPDELSRSYSLIVATFPLPTLNVTLGATRSDRFTDDRKTATTDNFSLTSTAQIYPDLTASLNGNYVVSDREQTEGVSVTSDTLTSRFTLNARLHPKLIADLTANYRHLNPPATDSTSATDTTLSLLYRPSDLLSMRLTGTRFWSGTDTPDTWAFNLLMALLRTEITRVNFRYDHTDALLTRDSFGLDASWDMSRTLSLQARGNYTLSEEDRWNFLVSLSMFL